jgi:hypothetical protein
MRSADTDPEAERVHIELLRSATPSRRIALGLSLTSLALHLAHRALWQAHPTDTAEEHAIRFVTTLYGAELGAGLARKLDARRLGRPS